MLEGTAIERKIANLLVIDQAAERSGDRVYACGARIHDHLQRGAADLKRNIQNGILTDIKVQSLTHNGFESRSADADLIIAGLEHRRAEVARIVRDEGRGNVGGDVTDADSGFRDDRAGRVGNSTLDASADGLGEGGQGRDSGKK